MVASARRRDELHQSTDVMSRVVIRGMDESTWAEDEWPCELKHDLSVLAVVAPTAMERAARAETIASQAMQEIATLAMEIHSLRVHLSKREVSDRESISRLIAMRDGREEDERQITSLSGVDMGVYLSSDE